MKNMAPKLLLLLLPMLLLSCQKESSSEEPLGQGYLEISSRAEGKQYFQKRILCKGTCPGDLGAVALEPVPKMTPCTMIYGGPEEISFRGEVRGEKISSQFNRSGGCEIDRFESAVLFLEKQGISRKKLFPKMNRPPKIKETPLP